MLKHLLSLSLYFVLFASGEDVKQCLAPVVCSVGESSTVEWQSLSRITECGKSSGNVNPTQVNTLTTEEMNQATTQLASGQKKLRSQIINVNKTLKEDILNLTQSTSTLGSKQEILVEQLKDVNVTVENRFAQREAQAKTERGKNVLQFAELNNTLTNLSQDILNLTQSTSTLGTKQEMLVEELKSVNVTVEERFSKTESQLETERKKQALQIAELNKTLINLSRGFSKIEAQLETEREKHVLQFTELNNRLLNLSKGWPAAVRLVNGSTANQGRVEIWYNGTWGTVCDDRWDLRDAEVVCRQLGFPGATSFKRTAFFGQGTGEILLDEVQCAGEESYLEHCAHRSWGFHDCDHGEDAGVVCKLK